MTDCVTLCGDVIPSKIVGGIGGRPKALLCKAQCGERGHVIIGGGITVWGKVRHRHVVEAVHVCSYVEVVGTEYATRQQK